MYEVELIKLVVAFLELLTVVWCDFVNTANDHRQLLTHHEPARNVGTDRRRDELVVLDEEKS